MTQQNTEPDTFTPPEGYPSAREMQQRRDQAVGILRSRRITVTPRPEQMVLLSAGLARLLRAKGLIASEDELNYFMALADVESLVEVVAQTAPQNLIHLPGRPS